MPTGEVAKDAIEFVTYESEHQLPLLQRLIDADLSEPYSVFTYRYFLNTWPHMCILAMCGKVCVGTIVGKCDPSKKGVRRGYIAMLDVDKQYRNRGLGTTVSRLAAVHQPCRRESARPNDPG